MTSIKKKKSLLSNSKSLKAKDDKDEAFILECESVYLSVFNKLEEEITSQDELLLLLQHAGRNPSKKTIEKYWGPSIDSYDYNQFCSILKQEGKTNKRDLLKAFQKIDRNGDGFITHDELYEVLTKRGERMTKSEVKSMIADADFNGDGKLDYEEFCEMMDTTSNQLSKLHTHKNNKKPVPAPRGGFDNKVPRKETNRHDEQRTSKSQKPSIMSKLSQRESTSRDEVDKIDKRDGLPKLKAEPKDLGKWQFHMTKGCFYKEEDGNIESHHFQIKTTQPTTVWMTITHAAPKYGKFDDAILESDMTLFLMESKGGRLIAFSNAIIDGKNCLQAEVDIGIYDVLTFTSGSKLNDEHSTSGQVGLVKGKGDDAKLTKPCKDSLFEIFYRCDLDGNGYLSQEEFNEFQMRSSGEGCDNEAWSVVKETIEVNPQSEMTANGFLNLNTMEARDPEGGSDELWVTLESLGYNRKLILTKACPFQVEIFTKFGKNSISLLGVSDGGKPLKNAVNEAIRMLSNSKQIKGKRDLNLHVADFVNRTSLAVENLVRIYVEFCRKRVLSKDVGVKIQSHALVGVQLDCSSSQNLMSDQGTLIHVDDVKPKEMTVFHHLVSEKKGESSKLRYQESIVR